MNRKFKRNRQAGFSLIEMMIVLVILTLVIGVTMTAINDVQKRSRIEEARVDLNQETRDFVDQIVRDLHQSGYPTAGMYNATPNVLSKFYAQGITNATQISVTFEGDVDGDGAVDVVSYQLSTDTTVAPAGQCPCKLQRSQLPKPDMAPTPAPVYNIEVDQVLNSMGTAAGAWTIAGSFPISNTVNVLNDTYYASFKTNPVFRYYNTNGNELVPVDGTNFTEVPGAVPTCLSPGCAATVADIRSVKVSVSTLSRLTDPVTKAFQAASVSASARIANR